MKELVDSPIEPSELIVEQGQVLRLGERGELVTGSAARRSCEQIRAHPFDEFSWWDPTGVSDPAAEASHPGFADSTGRLRVRIVPQERQRGVTFDAREQRSHCRVIGEQRLPQLRLGSDLGSVTLPAMPDHRTQLGMQIR